MNNTTKKLVFSGIIAALYIALTISFGPLAFGIIQIRPAEGMCLLPLIFIEAVPGLFVGCLLSNLIGGFGILDIFIGSLATLLAAETTYLIGRFIKNKLLKFVLGGLPPVLYNAIAIPFVLILSAPDANLSSYFAYFFSILITQSIWVYLLGVPTVIGTEKLLKK